MPSVNREPIPKTFDVRYNGFCFLFSSNWSEIASNIRRLDHFACVLCGATDLELHVHHIVYLSNFGTHRQENLVSACRKCHEDEHERELDFGERDSDATSQAAT